MSACKKNKRKDFQRVKLKVGRKVPKGLNFTETSFISKKIILREQLKVQARCVSEEISGALQKLTSNNSSIVVDGIQAATRLQGAIGCSLRQDLLRRLGPLTSNPDLQVREGAITLIRMTLDKTTTEQRSLTAGRLVLHLQCALTNLNWSTKLSGLHLLEVLLRYVPEVVVKNFSVMDNLMDLVSSTREQDPETRKLNMELKCGPNHLKVWRDVVRHAARFAQQVVRVLFGGGTQHLMKSCGGVMVASRINYSGFGSHSRVNLQHGESVAYAFLPVLLAMWSGIENSDVATSIMQRDLFLSISTAMLEIMEWAKASHGRLSFRLQALSNDIITFFKPRIPLKLGVSGTADIDLRLAKLMILVREGGDASLITSFFNSLDKADAFSAITATLAVAEAAVCACPSVVLSYINSLFFLKTAAVRRPFYKFYQAVLQKRINDLKLDFMLLKVAPFVSKIIIQYPNDCNDELMFLEKVHSYMLPAYLEGLSSLKLSTLAQILKNTHEQSNLGLRLIVDQKKLCRDHLKIIVDLWFSGDLVCSEISFVVQGLTSKIDRAFSSLASDPEGGDLMESYVTLVHIFVGFVLVIYLHLDEETGLSCTEGMLPHAQQKHLEYFRKIHRNVLTLVRLDDSVGNRCYGNRTALDNELRCVLLHGGFIRDSAVDYVRRLLQSWDMAADENCDGSDQLLNGQNAHGNGAVFEALSFVPSPISSLTLINVLYLVDRAVGFDDDNVEVALDKQINQLFVSQFLYGSEAQDQFLLDTCIRFYRRAGPASMLQDLERIMNAGPDECDDRLHKAFAKSIAFCRDRLLIDRETASMAVFRDLVEDAMRIAEGSGDSNVEDES